MQSQVQHNQSEAANTEIKECRSNKNGEELHVRKRNGKLKADGQVRTCLGTTANHRLFSCDMNDICTTSRATFSSSSRSVLADGACISFISKYFSHGKIQPLLQLLRPIPCNRTPTLCSKEIGLTRDTAGDGNVMFGVRAYMYRSPKWFGTYVQAFVRT